MVQIVNGVRRAKYYPKMPPGLAGETDFAYTDRLTGDNRTGRTPYDHIRNRQCSIGYHGARGDLSECKALPVPLPRTAVAFLSSLTSPAARAGHRRGGGRRRRRTCRLSGLTRTGSRCSRPGARARR